MRNLQDNACDVMQVIMYQKSPKGIWQYLVIRANTIKGLAEDEIFGTPLIKKSIRHN